MFEGDAIRSESHWLMAVQGRDMIRCEADAKTGLGPASFRDNGLSIGATANSELGSSVM